MALSKKEAREDEILRVLGALFYERGFSNVRMSEVAEKSGISVGTLYSHFTCKEDLVLALAIQGFQLRLKETQAAVRHGGTPVERYIIAHLSGWRFTRNNPSHVEMEFLGMAPAIWKRASRRLRLEFSEVSREGAQFFGVLCSDVFEEILSDSSPSEQQEFLAGSFGLALGMDVASLSEFASQNQGAIDWEKCRRENFIRFLSGWGWPHGEVERLVADVSANLDEPTVS